MDNEVAAQQSHYYLDLLHSSQRHKPQNPGLVFLLAGNAPRASGPGSTEGKHRVSPYELLLCLRHRS